MYQELFEKKASYPQKSVKSGGFVDG